VAEVVLVRWPQERSEAAGLVGTGVALLYLVEVEGEPPVPSTCLEDWVRLPGDERDLSARVRALEARVAVHRTPPAVDEEGQLVYHGQRLALSAGEARLARALVARFGDVVLDDELHEDAGGESVRSALTRLRSRLRDTDLVLRRVRRRGYTLTRR
jgi:DNA-binding response OmpR family regulator